MSGFHFPDELYAADKLPVHLILRADRPCAVIRGPVDTEGLWAPFNVFIVSWNENIREANEEWP